MMKFSKVYLQHAGAFHNMHNKSVDKRDEGGGM